MWSLHSLKYTSWECMKFWQLLLCSSSESLSSSSGSNGVCEALWLTSEGASGGGWSGLAFGISSSDSEALLPLLLPLPDFLFSLQDSLHSLPEPLWLEPLPYDSSLLSKFPISFLFRHVTRGGAGFILASPTRTGV